MWIIEMRVIRYLNFTWSIFNVFKETCRLYGSDLVDVLSDAENKFVVATAVNLNGRYELGVFP